jgi:hypothetical protein
MYNVDRREGSLTYSRNRNYIHRSSGFDSVCGNSLEHVPRSMDHTIHWPPAAHVDGSRQCFLAAEWRNAYKLAIISLSHTGAESHNYLGVRERLMDHCEKYIARYRQNATLCQLLCLALSMKALNDTWAPTALF